jgi:ABC-type transport system involved in multi-copper enzyme maturation permease subunit
MRWLLWKDYRHNRVVVSAGLFFLLAPHLIALYATCRGWFVEPQSPSRWKSNFVVSSLYSLVLSQVTVALIGGNAIAGERVDRSAEFLASLPISRGRNLASKLLLALAIIAIIWLTSVPILLYWTDPLGRGPLLSSQESLRVIANVAITGAAFFGVAWLLSSFIASPAIAVCGGLITPVIVGSGMAFLDYLFEWDWTGEEVELLYRGILLICAPVCFAVGTWHYLRRVEP